MADIEKSDTAHDPAVASSSVSSSSNELNTVEEKKLLRKLDRYLLPGVSILYLLSFLDRSNVANAKLDGLTTSLHMTSDQYLTGLTVFFIGYISLEVFWNIILKRVGPRLWLPSVTLAWGIVSTLQGIVVNKEGFYVVRTFLGITEGALFPGVVFYFSMWYKRSERVYRISLFFSAASLAGAFGGIFAYGIGFMDGVAGLKGWNWIFIIEGILTCVVAAAGYWFIQPWPSQAKFLSVEEHSLLNARLKADSDTVNEEAFAWSEVFAAFKDPKCWLYCALFHTCSLPLYTLSLFLPSIIAALGYTAADAQLLTIPPYALATILTFLWAILAEKYQRRGIFITISSSVAVIGYILLLSNKDPKAHPAQSYVGTFFAAAGIYPSTALVLSWPAINVSGQTKRATACAMQITIGNLGAVIGTQLYRSEDSPRYIVGYSVALGYIATNAIIAAVTWWVLKRENARRDATGVEAKVDSYGADWKGDGDVRWRYAL